MAKFPKIDALDLRKIPSQPDSSSTASSTHTAQSQAYSRDRGRHAPRSGASVIGTLSNWVNSIVDKRVAERQRRKVSDRAMDLYCNDAMAHGLCESIPVDLVNTGLTPQAQPMTDWLGMTPEWADDYQQRVAGLFEIWGLDNRCWADAHRRLNIYGLQALAAFLWKLDGIALFQVLRIPRPMAPLNLHLLPIDSARLVTPSDLQNADVYDGFEVDMNGGPTAAYLAKRGTQYTGYASVKSDQCVRVPIFDEATGLPNLLVVCDVRNISEYRQDSILGAVIKEIRDQNDFVDAALVKALIANLFTLFIESNYQESGAVQSFEDRIKEISKGTIILGSANEIPHVINGNDQPGPSYEMMNRSIVSRVGMASGRGAENVSQEYKASYSASQASLENLGKWGDYERAVLVNRFCGPVHSTMQYEAALRGMLPVRSARWMLENLHAVTRTEWLPPKLRPIDKSKAAKADEIRLGTMTRSWSDIFGEQSRDWRSGLRQCIRELAFIRDEAEKFGLSMEEVLGRKSQSGPVDTSTSQGDE